jgi:hypothetical protein
LRGDHIQLALASEIGEFLPTHNSSRVSKMKMIASVLSLTFALTVTAFAKTPYIYLDKLNPALDKLYNDFNEDCRGEPGGSEASERGCAARNKVSAQIRALGCKNIYPAPAPATSYWICPQRPAH